MSPDIAENLATLLESIADGSPIFPGSIPFELARAITEAEAYP